MTTASTTLISNYEASPQVMSPSYQLGGVQRVAVGTIALATTDLEANDIVMLAPIPSNAAILSIKLYNDDLDSGTTNTCDVGLYTTAGVVVDDDVYASAITDLRGAVLTGTEVAFEARNVNLMGQRVWEDAGATTDTGGYYYVALTFDAAANTAGDLSWWITYVTQA